MFNRKMMFLFAALAASAEVQAIVIPVHTTTASSLMPVGTPVSPADSGVHPPYKILELKAREPKRVSGKPKPHLTSRDTVEKLIDAIGVAQAAVQLGVDVATLQQYTAARSLDDVEIESREPKGVSGKPRLPSRDTVQKLIDAVGIAQAAAQLGVDIATLQQYTAARSLEFENTIETREPKGVTKKPRLPSRDTVQKLIDAVGIAQAAAQLGVDVATLQQYTAARSVAIETRKPKGVKGKPRLPSRDAVEKLIDAVGIAQAAAQLGIDIATLQQYTAARSIDVEARAPKGVTGKPRLSSRDTVQKLIEAVGIAQAAAQLGVDVATLQQLTGQ